VDTDPVPEFVTLGEETIKGPVMPIALRQHCLVKINESTVIIMGGMDAYTKTWFYNFDNNGWSDGPDLPTYRNRHSCGMFWSPAHQGRPVIVVGGTYSTDVWYQVDFLDLSTGIWTQGF
jgi:hypothetical protein